VIIFLDIDGVLVCEGCTKEAWGRHHFDPECVRTLNRLVRETKAKIVISSDWRYYHSPSQMGDIFDEEGVQAEIVGETPYLVDGTRGDEILKWIQDNKYTGHFLVIYDDVFDIEPYKDIPRDCIIHVKDGWDDGGLKDKHIDPILNSGMVS
jgi:hypothetical protein